jgi:hypothetical protein
MRNYYTIKLMAILLVVLPFAFSACVKDTCSKSNTYTYYKPVYKTKTEVRNNIKSNTAREVENPGKLCLLGNYIFLNEVDRGVHIIDNSNPAQPRNIGFIDIPGNLDIAVKGTTLYADLFTDLVAIDISNPQSVSLKKVVEGLFPYRYYGNGFVATSNSEQIITDWEKRDTTIVSSCTNEGWIDFGFSPNVFFALSSASSSAIKTSSSPIGVGGSMARFTIVENRLYTVGNTDLDVFNISNPIDPIHTSSQSVGWNIETIYPFKNKLFIGSASGMFIYNINNADAPASVGQFSHTRSCDPVIADDTYAYVTLRSGNTCQGFTNQLEIVKLNNITDPVLQKTYPMTNPHGLSKDDDLLFICDGKDGLKVYNASNVMNLQLLTTIPGIETYDVIAMNNIALVVAKDGLYQYNYADPVNLKLISRIGLSK